jgi:hypothetical protein
MDALVCKGYQQAALFICKLRGGSQPILVEGTNGLLYVLKFNDNLQGPQVPFNEVAGAELFRAFHLPVAQWEPLLITGSFLDANPGCWPLIGPDRCRPQTGLCFASRFLGDPVRRLIEVLPGSSLSRIRNRASFWLAWLLDVCCDHADNRQAIFSEDSKGWLHASFIDSGHLLRGAHGDRKPNIWSSRYLDPRIYEGMRATDATTCRRTIDAFNPDRAHARILNMPRDWMSPPAVRALNHSLDRLADRLLARAIWEMLLDSSTLYARTPESEFGCNAHENLSDTSHGAIPQPGVPASCEAKPRRMLPQHCLPALA